MPTQQPVRVEPFHEPITSSVTRVVHDPDGGQARHARLQPLQAA